ncbi:hypothetical protein HAX54_047529 [Datura stramonium]|uniref:Protein ENHANCED DISEASE RESISTANCE 2 C-terminal domain-containing protein n=1 Tax=Datura stramonium TaxID=4076 RepID=A0ABS8ST92_DATST|nr:hypothetical protein [Datura stramonium]
MCSTIKQKQNLHHQRSAVLTSTSAVGGGRDWREESIAGGSLKHVDLDKGKNGYITAGRPIQPARAKLLNEKSESTLWCLASTAGRHGLAPIQLQVDHVLARHDNRVMHAREISLRRQVSQNLHSRALFLHLALGYVTSVTIDMGFLVEAQTEEELPEKLFGAVRVCQMEMSSATFVDTTSARKVLPTANLHNPINSSRVQARRREKNEED